MLALQPAAAAAVCLTRAVHQYSCYPILRQQQQQAVAHTSHSYQQLQHLMNIN